MPSTVRRPTPGQAKIVSVITVPARSAPNCKPRIVMTGARAFALANALAPVITILGLQFGALLAGTVITETIFAWPGVGRLTVEGIQARDYPVLQGCILAIAAGFVLASTLADIVNAALDPRTREAR